MPLECSLTTFTPGEAERITNVSVGLQRDWRRRGFLPSNDGHARFNAFDLARIMFLKCMADRGIGPHDAVVYADKAAAGIFVMALQQHDAMEGFETTEPVVRQALAVLRMTAPAAAADQRFMPTRFFILWADGSEAWEAEIDDTTFNQPTERLLGPVIIIDHQALGGALFQRATRTLALVSWADPE